MESTKYSGVWSIHTCLAIALITVSVIRFDVFGILGLVGYGVLIAYTAVGCIINARKLHFVKCFPFYAGIAYYAVYLLMSLINGSYTRIWSSLIQLFILMLIAFINKSNDEINRDFETFSHIAIIAGILMSILSILLSAITTFLPETLHVLPQNLQNEIARLSGNLHGRISGLSGNANQTAVYCYVGLALSIYTLATNRNIRWRITSIVNIVLALYTIFIATASRTSMLAVIAFTGSYILAYYLIAYKNDETRKRHFKILLLIALCAILLFAILIIIIPSFRNFILTDVVRIDSLSTGSNRTSVYQAVLEWGENRRLTGFDIEEFADETGWHDTHNMVLEVLSTAGAIGLILFFIYFGASISTIIKNFSGVAGMDNKEKNIRCFFLAYIIGYLVWGLTETGRVNAIYQISFLVQIVFGYSSVMLYNRKTKEHLIADSGT